MEMGQGNRPPLKVDPELLGKYGNELLTSAGGLPAAPGPFVVSGSDPISVAIAEKLPAVEGAILDELPQLKQDASTTASNIVAAADRYSSTDSQLAAEYQRHQFDSAGGTASADSMSQLMGMSMQTGGQTASVMTSAPQGLVQAAEQGVQQVGQLTGGMGSLDARLDQDSPPDAAAGDLNAERAPEPEGRGAPEAGVSL
jgi:hypothetical protein